MTYLTAAFEFDFATECTIPLPPPRSPEEVISILIAEAPEGEHSVDAL